MTHPFATRTFLLRTVRDRPVVLAAANGIRHKTVWLMRHLPGNFADERFLQQSIDGSGAYPTVPELLKSEFLVKGCKPDSATHGTKNMIANRRMAVSERSLIGKSGVYTENNNESRIEGSNPSVPMSESIHLVPRYRFARLS